jgi:hypothetical protein
MTKDFHERFKIPIDFDEARRRFVNRAQNLMFDEGDFLRVSRGTLRLLWPNRVPGTIPLWRGWKRLTDLTQGWLLATGGEICG